MTINLTGVKQGDVVKETINYFEKLNSCHMSHIIYIVHYMYFSIPCQIVMVYRE